MTKKKDIRQRQNIAKENKTRFFPSEDWPGGRRRSLTNVRFAFMLMQAKLQVEPLQERPVDSGWPVTAMRSERAAGRGSDRGSRMERCWHQESRLLAKSTPADLWGPRGARAAVGVMSTWAQLPPSGATAVFLGAHQHFAVQLLLLLFEGIFYLGSFQSSVPATHWNVSHAPGRTRCRHAALR